MFMAGATHVPAQTAGTGALTGTVTDTSGSAVPNVTITATNSETGQTRIAHTDTSGAYSLTLLPPGLYNVSFTATGFRTAEVTGVRVNVTETPVLDKTLEVGSQTEQILVEAEVGAVQTASSTLGTVVGERSVSGLPLTTRNYTQIIGLSAGVSTPVNNASAAGNGSQDVSVNGMNSNHNNYQMDGVSITPIGGGGSGQGFYSGIGVPSPDAIAEFKIQTSLYDAGYGRNPGANVNVVTKSGTNTWHGAAFEFFRNTALNANDFFANRNNAGKEPLNQNQFGGVIGGPLKKDKLFIFGSYQRTGQKNGVDPTGHSSPTLPPIPPGDRNAPGFQAALGAAFCHSPTFAQELSLGGISVACDGSNINPVAMNILRLQLPDGQYYIPSSPTGTYSTVTFVDPAIYTENQYVVNADYYWNARNTISTRFFYSNENQSQGFICIFPGCLPGSGGANNFQNTAAVLKLTSTLTNALVNEARVSFQRNLALNGTRQKFTDSQVGITSVTPGIDYLAPINILGEFGSGGATEPDFNVSNQYQWSDQLSWARGRHTIRVGGEIEHIQWPWVFPGISKGQLLFETFPDFLLGLPSCAPGTYPSTCNTANPGGTTGTPLSSILTTILAVRTPPSGIVHGYRINDASAFVQDDFKVSQRLTLNLGLRWEYDGYPSDIYGNLTNIWLSRLSSVPVPGNSPATGTYAGFVVPANYKGPPLPPGILKNSNDSPTRNGAPWDNLAPRFGFAWQPLSNNRFVVRGGYGYFYDRVNGNSLIHAVEQSPPYSLTLDGELGGAATLAVPYLNQPLGWGSPRWVNFATGASSNLNYPFMPENFTTPLVQSYNINLQYEFAPAWVLEVGYVGSHGIHLVDSGREINIAQLATPSNPINGITSNSVQNAVLRVPYLGFAPNGLQQNGTDGDLRYNSFQATLRKQFSHGLQLQAAYTYARAFTNEQANGAFYENLNSNDPADPKQQYGISPFYYPNRFVVSYSYDLPYKAQGFSGKLLDGWNLSGVTVFQTGQPLTVTDSRGGTAFCGSSCSAAFSNVTVRAQMAPGATYAQAPTPGGVEARLGGSSGGHGYVNAAAFSTTPTGGAYGNGTGFGNSGLGILYGPGQFNFDTALIKNTRVGGIHEEATLQFRAEFFNIFNHPQFSNPGV
ncbi:MAG TPA: carboxypeptidase-like regulatory domain-containing protein, partial [Bryobacteraceae bacterium]